MTALTPAQRDAARQRRNASAGMRRLHVWLSAEASRELDVLVERHGTIRGALEAAIALIARQNN